MKKEFLTISDGTFTLQETESEKQFLFYRNDDDVLKDITDEPMDFYQHYIMKKMIEGEINDAVFSNIYTEISDDGKCIRLTVTQITGVEEPSKKKKAIKKKKPNFFKWLVKKIFG